MLCSRNNSTIFLKQRKCKPNLFEIGVTSNSFNLNMYLMKWIEKEIFSYQWNCCKHQFSEYFNIDPFQFKGSHGLLKDAAQTEEVRHHLWIIFGPITSSLHYLQFIYCCPLDACRVIVCNPSVGGELTSPSPEWVYLGKESNITGNLSSISTW